MSQFHPQLTRIIRMASMDRLLDLMARLRDPDRGCPWDRRQTHQSIVPHTIEEAYEVADAVERGNQADLRDELGDLLFQVIFQTRIAEEAGSFQFEDVVRSLENKLIRRHPHVFQPDGTPVDESAPQPDLAEVERSWQRIKSSETSARDESDDPLAGVTEALPALMQAEKLSSRAAEYGFDWADPRDVVAKVREEIDEVEGAMAMEDRKAIQEELGDLLFSAANLTRHLGINAEYSLKLGNKKFKRRFSAMAAVIAAQGRSLTETDLDGMEQAWRAVKLAETKASPP